MAKFDSLLTERRVLGVLLQSPGAGGVLAHLQPKYFAGGGHQAICAALAALGDKADIVTVFEWLADRRAAVTDADLAALIEGSSVATFGHVITRYAETVVNAHFERTLDAARLNATLDGIKALIGERDAALAAINQDTALATFTAAALQGMTFDPPRWAVPGLLPEGLTLLGGKPKVGKSWLALSLAVAVAHGGCALGAIAVDPGDVLYLALEDTPRRLKERLAVLHPDGGTWPDVLELKTEWPRGTAGADLIDTWLTRHPDARLVIVDTLGKWRPPVRGNGGYQADYDDLVTLKAVADKHGVCLLAVTHLRKMSSEDVFDQITGTLGLTGAADACLVLTRGRGEKTAVLHGTSRDFDEFEKALTWDSGLWRIDGDAATVRLSAERRDIMELLKAYPYGLKAKDIADHLDKPFGGIRKLLMKLTQDGWLTQAEDKAYKVVKSGNTGNTGNAGNTGNTGNVLPTLPIVDTGGNAAQALSDVAFETRVTDVTSVTAFEQKTARYRYEAPFVAPDA